jgi:hypothetical protein
LNTLIRIEVIWSIEPTWDMCIVWYFSSFISSNIQRSYETLVCAVIRTSDPLGLCHFPRTLPLLLGLQHALPCCKDFPWLFIAMRWTVTIWSSLEVSLRIFRTAVFQTADLRIRRQTCNQLSHATFLNQTSNWKPFCTILAVSIIQKLVQKLNGIWKLH